MRLSVINGKTDKYLHIIKSVRKGNIVTSVVIKKCGKLSELSKIYDDPISHFEKEAKELTNNEKEEDLIIKYSQNKKIISNERRSYNAGYLFLKSIFYKLSLDKWCKKIVKSRKIEYDFLQMLEYLTYSRILFPKSKLSTFELSEKYIERRNFKLHDIYRSLDLIAENMDEIQSFLYEHSKNILQRDTSVLYYDVTNYFFEIDAEDELRKYGYSKENRHNPIVQMGLFIDANGLPLAFSINNGSENEQIGLKPLEKKLIDDFKLSKFIVCTDSGLGSNSNRYFNSQGDRGFIVTQSVKKLKKYLRDWIIDDCNWKSTNQKVNSISDLENCNEYDLSTILYKSRWINDKQIVYSRNDNKVKNSFEQRLIVSYSPKYKAYKEKLRTEQINKALKIINNPIKYNKGNISDCKKFIRGINFTKEGEIAENLKLELDTELIAEESKYDGFYCIATNLADDELEIVKLNKHRWQIEQCFRIMKTDFKSRPVFLTNENRIKAHFLICFLALLFYRILETKINENISIADTIRTMQELNFLSLKDMAFTPTFEKNEIVDELQSNFSIFLDFEVITKNKLKKIISSIKK